MHKYIHKQPNKQTNNKKSLCDILYKVFSNHFLCVCVCPVLQREMEKIEFQEKNISLIYYSQEEEEGEEE